MLLIKNLLQLLQYLMRQNRSRITQPKSNINHIDELKNNLMSKFNNQQTNQSKYRPNTSFKNTKPTYYSQSDDLEIISFDPEQQKTNNLLQKAKMILQTTSNKFQIQKAKKALKMSNQQSQGMFLTGCGLYKAQQQQIPPFKQQFQPVDMNDALKYLVSHQKDDLQQLRKMIKKTNFDLKQYTHQISKTKDQVQNAADLFGKQLNVDLKVKINKCNLKANHTKNNSEFPAKRKISTSHQSRTKHIS